MQEAIKFFLDANSDLGPMPPTIAEYVKSIGSSDDAISHSIVADWNSYCAM
jgi:hypothetical protein